MRINDKHFSLISAAEVKQITSPLENLNIKFFNHVRCYHDGSYSTLINDAAWHSHFLALELPGSFSVYDLQQGAYLWEDVVSPEICVDARNFFDIDNLFQFIYPKDNYVDIFAFGSQARQPGMISFYFNHLDLLQNFIQYFKQKSVDLFKKTDKERVLTCEAMRERTNLKNTDVLHSDRVNFLQCLNGDVKRYHLTKQEIKCLKYLAQGKTAKEIAQVLNIAFRTVETHIAKIKLKTNCSFKKELIDIFYKQARVAPYLDNN